MGVPLKADFNPDLRFVRVTGERNGFIEFEFAVGEPDLAVEMILTPAAFEEFCTANAATRLSGDEGRGTAGSDWSWNLSDATGTRFRSGDTTARPANSSDVPQGD